MPTQSEAQGFPREEPVTMPAPRWKAIRRQVTRMVVSWRHVHREAERILEGCKHAPGCLAVADRTRPCLPSCPDRETYLSALVCASNAAEFIAIKVPSRLDGDYSPPARETWDAVLAELAARDGARELLDELARPELALAQHVDAQPDDEQPATRLVAPPADDEPQGGPEHDDNEHT